MEQIYLEWILLLGALLLPGIAHLYIMSTYNKYSRGTTKHDKTGFDVAREICDRNGLNNLYIVETGGKLTDHYDPKRRTIRLSHEVYHGKSVASLAVAAHEAGHAIQDKEGYSFFRMRSFIFPIVNLGTGFSYILIFIGLFLGMLELLWLGIALVSLGLIFQLVTLPVEFDASKKAKAELAKINITDDNTQNGTSKVLNAAAFTYVAGALASAMTILRLILIANRRR